MDPVSPLDGIAELLRKKIAAESISNSSSKSGVSKTKLASQASAQFQRSTTDELMRKIIGVVDTIDANDSKRNAKIIRLFVENVLTWQFGDEVLNDASFCNIVDEVSVAMEANSEIASTMSSWLARQSSQEQ